MDKEMLVELFYAPVKKPGGSFASHWSPLQLFLCMMIPS